MKVASDAMTFFGTESLQNPYPLYERMRAEGPVHRIADSEFYAVCGWDAVNDAISRPGDFSSNLTATMTYSPDGKVAAFEMDQLGGPTHVLATADDPAHAVHRKLLVRHLAARRIRSLERFVSETAERLWFDGLQGGRIEWMDAIANRLPMMVVAELIGLPDADIAQLVQWGYGATQLLEGLVDQDQLADAGIAVMQLSGCITEQFARAAADPQENLLGELATACAAGELDSLTANLMMVMLFAAGGESTASLLGSAVWILATRPDIQQQVRDNPQLLGAFVEETLRYEAPFRAHYRHVRNDTTLGGLTLPADSHLLLMWGAANRDPVQFDAPEEFRLDRPGGKGHISFGKGAHFCVGAALARLEAQIVLRLLLERTTVIEAADVGRWLPSMLVRRLENLELAVR
ncbi:cytochrome P450 [Mycobacterium ulcerans]|uniref:Cytochrome P450 144A4 Cyp144A4 n=1 Tax=Mycobacterium ulcerans (strain Agy99) TaxID=362242 RepID=A0PSP4_MYCUA|nr:cytochrome P450 [Mycobacterium ulcerans]ABL05363.1 cytochrome P450 144A4 Cyp144A4 [Mycobacterium ulcerans Agy99]MEB3904705.1 cytochrome P450 [Mycobacterium ulcerans]MEB3908899.1 cytochrome P450 [Mycobacterium ulcerans]MEB3919129.1 cytochrome P450 [Mycobacterium ulcerans]MEB3923251.1 cytochrome P450 [Mycobacterium ulcerans]